MNILHINTNNLRGGAAKVMMRLAAAQKELDNKVNVLVGTLETSNENVFPFAKKRNTINSKEKGYIDYEYTGVFELINNPLFLEADIVNIHNLHGYYFNPYALSILSHLKPIVWTLHDMQSITGHCSYSYDCMRWKIGCGECPHLNEYPSVKFDRTNRNWLEKKDIYDHSKLFIVPVAKWIEEIASKGILKNHPMETILNGVDIQIYKPLNKKEMRRKYGIPENKFIIGAVANGGTFGEERKGGKFVQEVMDRLIKNGYDVLLVNVGGENKEYINENLYNVGYISSEKEMAEVYNTFDMYLFPSVADTCPLVISEAMSCGIPIVTFATGGIPEMVQHGKTGYVAPLKNSELLYQYTEKLILDNNKRYLFSQSSRKYCIENFDHNFVVEKYLKLYQRAISKFEKERNSIFYFEKDEVPKDIWNLKEFQMSEQVKKVGTLKNSEQTKKNLIIVTNRPTYFSNKYSIISFEKIKNYVIQKNDIFYIDHGNYKISNDFFEKMLYKNFQTDILSSTIILQRKNKKKFFLTASNIENGIMDSGLASAFYSAPFFEKNKKKILNGEYIEFSSIEEFNTELITIDLERFMKKKITKEKIYIYGAGNHTVELITECSFINNKIMGIIDKNSDMYGEKLLDEFEIISLFSIEEDIPILISSATYEQEIYEELKEKVSNQLIKIYNFE